MKVKLKINSYLHREQIINALAHHGYKVWVETIENRQELSEDYLVCFELSSGGKETKE